MLDENNARMYSFKIQIKTHFSIFNSFNIKCAKAFEDTAKYRFHGELNNRLFLIVKSITGNLDFSNDYS